MILNIRHVGLVVQDLEKQVLFYSALGFCRYRSEMESGYFVEQLTGIDKVKIKWVKMKSPDGVVLELLKYCQPESGYEYEKSPTNQLGCSHVAFTVNRINDTCRLIVKNGGSVVNRPAVSPDGKVVVAYCHDPEGILLEVVEEVQASP